ncbi:MAG: hypothetical protein Q7R52_02005 [archaeon]|nr:hypothetical protein [archaeon]
MEQNKKTFLIISIILIFILIIPNVISKECDFGADIYLNFDSLEKLYNTPSEYRFPLEMRENDWLFLNNILVVNTGSCTLPPSVIKLKIKPSGGYTPPEKHTDNYGDFYIRIPSLNASDKYEMTFSKPLKFNIKLNKKLISNETWWHWPILLDELGDWIILPSFELEQEGISGYGYNTFINGNINIQRFRVYSKLELENKKTSKIALYVAITSVIITLLTLLIDIIFRSKSIKTEKKKINLLNAILNTIRKNFKKKQR